MFLLRALATITLGCALFSMGCVSNDSGMEDDESVGTAEQGDNGGGIPNGLLSNDLLVEAANIPPVATIALQGDFHIDHWHIAPTPLQSSVEGRRILHYLIAVSLDSGESLVISPTVNGVYDDSIVEYGWRGFAPKWKYRALTLVEQELVTSAVAGMANNLPGAHPKVKDYLFGETVPALELDRIDETCYGNMFNVVGTYPWSEHRITCCTNSADPDAVKALVGRLCDNQGNCNPIAVSGRCENLLPEANCKGEGLPWETGVPWAECFDSNGHGWNNTVTVTVP